jgi:hypothetical protein
MNAKDDICIVQIENKDFPSLSLGDSNSVQTGDEIYVASNPEGLEGSITKGIISSVRAEVGLFQIDAAISPGSSGGVLVNTKGQAVGIVSSSLIGGQNLNFAIPINKLKKIPLKYRHTIQLAGACAYTDLEKERLKGPVKSVESRGYPKARESNRIISNELITLGIETYDREGILIESEIHDGTNGRLAVTQKFFYDENRIKTSLREESTLNGKVGEMRFDFDDGIYNKLYGKGFSGSAGRLDGQGGMKVYNSNGDVTAWYFRGVKYTYEYNDDGRVLTQTQSRDGVEEIITRFSYKDDKYGNWIEKFGAKRYPNTQGVNPGQWFPIETEYRNIVYYGQE